MTRNSETPRVPLQISRGAVVASIQVDLDEAVLARFQEDLLRCLHETGTSALVLDVSGLEILDSVELGALRRIMTMAELMGARALLVGLRPGVVAALVAADADVEGIEVAIDLDAAFERLEAATDAEPELPPEEPVDAPEPAPDVEPPPGAEP